MRNSSNEDFVATKVLIEFEDGPMSFRIPRGATLADVSEKLDRIGRWHRGQPLAIDVRFGAANDNGRASVHPFTSCLISQIMERHRHSAPSPRVSD